MSVSKFVSFTAISKPEIHTVQIQEEQVKSACRLIAVKSNRRRDLTTPTFKSRILTMQSSLISYYAGISDTGVVQYQPTEQHTFSFIEASAVAHLTISSSKCHYTVWSLFYAKFVQGCTNHTNLRH